MLSPLPMLLLLAAGCSDRPDVDRPPPGAARAAPVPCLGAPPCDDRRELIVDGAEIAYDHHEVTRRVRLAELAAESELSIAVRLLLGEVGPERLVANRHAREEALGVLATVHNRLDPARWNPEDQPAQPWPGCGEGSRFADCATPDQYRGLRAWRALHPAENVSEDVLEPAVAVAVSAFWQLETGVVVDPTGGAVSFVHRCGGAGYGEPSRRCDGQGDDDIEGANPSTGPAVFRGPDGWDAEQGRYRMWRQHQVDYEARDGG